MRGTCVVDSLWATPAFPICGRSFVAPTGMDFEVPDETPSAICSELRAKSCRPVDDLASDFGGHLFSRREKDSICHHL